MPSYQHPLQPSRASNYKMGHETLKNMLQKKWGYGHKGCQGSISLGFIYFKIFKHLRRWVHNFRKTMDSKHGQV
jgi:hypothetical protein